MRYIINPFHHCKSFYETISSFYTRNRDAVRKIVDSLNVYLAIGSLISFLAAITCTYIYLFPNFRPIIPINGVPMFNNSVITECNVFEGNWVEDESYPLYDASRCPFAERGFNCLANGRRDSNYTKWRWKPRSCDILRFNASTIIDHLRGKRVVFVGDSLSRTQWESFLCMLMTGVEDKKSVYEINGHKTSKNIPFLKVKFRSLDIRVDFYRSVFLMQTGSVPKGAPKRVKSTLRLDKLDGINREWIDSDVLVFNSGHWWTKTRLFHDMGCYFRVGDSIKLGMSVATGYRKALETWGAWAETMINTNRTRVFFRTFESTHWSGKKHDRCKLTRQPLLKPNGYDRSSISDIVIDVMKNVTVPVTVMHITPMDALRSDGHVGRWSGNPSVLDCSHWCLPGVPDMWNEILFSYLLPTKGFPINEQ